MHKIKISNNNIAIYHMHQNNYLKDCLCVVYTPTKKEMQQDALQEPYILILIKSKNDLLNIRTAKDCRTNNLFSDNHPILLRIASECLLGVFGDTHCDCESHRITSLREINKNGQGVYIHIPQEGQGNGLFYKIRELELQINGADPTGKLIGEKNVHEASKYLLGNKQPLDKRNYTALKNVFKQLSLNHYKYSLISDNPEKTKQIQKSSGVRIASSHNIKHMITVENAGEYLAKLYMKGCEISDPELEDIYCALFAEKKLPGRIISLLRYLEEDIAYGKEFHANPEILKKIVSLYKDRQYKGHVQDLEIFKNSISYTEYQTELKINKSDLELLFKNKLLINDQSLCYEENYFYDLIYLKDIAARSLKIRKAFRLMDRRHPISQKLIYKVPISNKTYTIKSVPIVQEDVATLIGFALRDHEVHFLPVFTHNLETTMDKLTILTKRYSKSLRTLSIMGDENKVKKFIKKAKKIIKIEEIDDPTNYKFIRKNLSLGFQWDALVAEELKLFKKYLKG